MKKILFFNNGVNENAGFSKFAARRNPANAICFHTKGYAIPFCQYGTFAVARILFGGGFSLKELTFIPFGAQYYRAPTPLEEDWLRDLTSFRDHGFNTVKLWAQWGWNMPKEEQFDFSDLDRLMDICRDLGLRVVINIIYDVAPHWFNKKYPESFMITLSGRILRPQSISCRQIGGAPGPCLHHPQGIECRRRFTEAVAQRYADHPAMFCWDLWNEPELTCGVARDPIQDHMVCYCEHSVRAFREWLKKQYGTLEALCKCWGAPLW